MIWERRELHGQRSMAMRFIKMAMWFVMPVVTVPELATSGNMPMVGFLPLGDTTVLLISILVALLPIPLSLRFSMSIVAHPQLQSLLEQLEQAT